MASCITFTSHIHVDIYNYGKPNVSMDSYLIISCVYFFSTNPIDIMIQDWLRIVVYPHISHPYMNGSMLSPLNTRWFVIDVPIAEIYT